jgi:DNA polymerase elongation subunit (family B)
VPEPKILLFDIETSLNRGYFFNLYQEGNIVEVESYWYMLSFAYKWLGQKKTHVMSLPDFKGYSRDKENDRALVTELHRLFGEADILIAHNGDKFDIKCSNARFIVHGLAPPSEYKSIDTLKLARKHFKFLSNRLDDLGHYLGLGRKLSHTGKALWLACMKGDPAGWLKMCRYNKQDVNLLHAVYLKLRPFTTTHPDLNNWTRADGCPICQSLKVESHGWRPLVSGKRKRMHCNGCGHHFVCGPIIRREKVIRA